MTALTQAEAQRHPVPLHLFPVSVITFQWEPAEGHCGDTVHLRAQTQNTPDGTVVNVTLRAQAGSSPHLVGFTATVQSNRFDHAWRISNVDFRTATSVLAEVQVEATANAATVHAAYLRVRARPNAAAQHFSENRTWHMIDSAGHSSNVPAHTRFDQRIENFRNKVEVTAEIQKAWGASYVDMNNHGVTGMAGGCPWPGYRWARSTSPTTMLPTEYYDGAHWVALPFAPNDTEFFSLAFYQSGPSTWVSPSAPGGTYAEAFADYNFDDSAYAGVRQGWVGRTHTKWTEKWALRRHGCPSHPSVHCCRYEVEVHLTFHTVTSNTADTILVAPHNLRSNMKTFFMGDTRAGTVPHEIGHIMDNPDEYQGGAIDPSITGDHAHSGLDAGSIMGDHMDVVRKRHYHAFAIWLRQLINTAYSNNDQYDTVDR